MLRTRIIPCLQLVGESLVKAVQFKKFGYIGDPINTVRIFNELEVDELCFLDIRATAEGRRPNLSILRQIADECFMPLSYGGGVSDVSQALEILAIGFEKIVINSAAFEKTELITQLAAQAGSQSVIVSIDVKRNIWGKYQVYSHDGTRKESVDPVQWARELEARGAGELLVTSMDRESTWKGFDVALIRRISEAVSIPVIAHGGAGTVAHIGEVVKEGGASAVALGSMVVYQKKGMGVLVNFPDKVLLENELRQES